MRFLPLLLLVPAIALAQTATTRPAPAAPAPSTPAAPARPAARPAPAQPAAAGAATGARRAAGATAARPAAAQPPVASMTDEQKTIYALGIIVQRSLRNFDFTPAELELVKRGLTEAASGKPALSLDEWGAKLQPFAQARSQRLTEKEKVASASYLNTAAAAAGAVRTETGIVYTELVAGTGASPVAADVVRVHYRGALRDGTEFDSSYARNEPTEFPVSRVIPCWTQGLQRMKVGGKARLVCPSDLAYGDAGNQDIPGGAALVFEVELLGIVTPAAN